MKKSFFLFLTVVLILSFLISSAYAMEIYSAIEKGDAERVTELIQERPGIARFKNYHYRLPLLVAIDKGNLEVVKAIVETALLKDIRLLDNPDYLNRAVEMDNLEIVRYLLSKGSKVNGRSFEGLTPLHYACINGNREIIGLLLENGAVLNATTYDRRRLPIHFLIYGKLDGYLSPNYHGPDSFDEYIFQSKADKKKRTEILAMLLEKGADVNRKDGGGSSPLHMAAAIDNISAVKILLERGADINAQDESGSTPLNFRLLNINKRHCCSEDVEISTEIPEYLIAKGADVSNRDKWRRTPLYYAAKNGFTKVVNAILKKGAAPDLSRRRGREIQALVYVCNNEPEKFKNLVEKYSHLSDKGNQNNQELFHLAIKENRFEITKYLVEKSFGVKVPKGSDSPLHYAARYNRSKIAEYLLDRGADPYARVYCFDYTPMGVAAKYGKFEVIEKMIEKGVSVNGGYKEGGTPLCNAASSGNIKMMKFLISKGAKIAFEDKPDLSVLKNTLHCNQVEAAKYLLKLGIKEKNPKVFQTILRDVRSPEMAKLLISQGAAVEDFYVYYRDDSWLRAGGHHLPPENLAVAKVLIQNGSNLLRGDMIFETPFSDALNSGNFKLARMIAENFPEKYVQENSALLLGRALQYHNFEVFKTLLDRGASVHSLSNDRPILCQAYDPLDYDIARLLIERGADVNAKGERGDNALYDAILMNIRVKRIPFDPFCVAKLLVSKGADYNVYTAAGMGRTDLIREFIRKDPDSVNRKNYRTIYPLEMALLTGHDEEAMIILNAMSKDTIDNMFQESGDTVYRDCPKTSAKLIEMKGPYSLVDNEGNSYLCIAVKNGNISFVDYLIKKGLDVNQRNFKGQTPLFFAAENGDVKMIRFLLSKGADVSIRDQDGLNPVQAIRFGTIYTGGLTEKERADVVFELIDNGIDVSGMTWLLSYAAWNGYSDAAVRLINKGFNPEENISAMLYIYGFRLPARYNTLFTAIQMNDKKVVDAIIRKGVDVNQKDKTGWTPLALAKANGYSELVELLIKNGAKE